MDYAALVLGPSIHGCEHGVELDPALRLWRGTSRRGWCRRNGA